MIIRDIELETVCGITSTLPEHTLPEVAFAGKSNVGKSSLINALVNRKSLARTSSSPGKTQTINFYHVQASPYTAAQRQKKEALLKELREAAGTETDAELSQPETEGKKEQQNQTGIDTGKEHKNPDAAEEKKEQAVQLERDLRDLDFYLVDLPGYGYAKASASVKEQWGKLIERYLRSSKQLRCVFLLVDIRHKPGENDRLMYDWICENGYRPVVIATKADKVKRGQIEKLRKEIRLGLGCGPDVPVVPFSAETKAGEDRVWGIVAEMISE